MLKTDLVAYNEIVAKLSPYLQKYATIEGNTDPLVITSGCVLLTSFIEWLDNPEQWAGAWTTADSSYVWCQVSNYERCWDLKSIAETIAEYERYARYSIHNIPIHFLDMVQKTVKHHGVESGVSSVTARELNSIIKLMGKFDSDNWEDNRRAALAAMMSDLHGYPSVENPVKIFLAGTDDCSWALCVETVEIADKIVTDLNQCATWAKLHDYGFVFTN